MQLPADGQRKHGSLSAEATHGKAAGGFAGWRLQRSD
jgi:hypothetical protein